MGLRYGVPARSKHRPSHADQANLPLKIGALPGALPGAFGAEQVSHSRIGHERALPHCLHMAPSPPGFRSTPAHLRPRGGSGAPLGGVLRPLHQHPVRLLEVHRDHHARDCSGKPGGHGWSDPPHTVAVCKYFCRPNIFFKPKIGAPGNTARVRVRFLWRFRVPLISVLAVAKLYP